MELYEFYSDTGLSKSDIDFLFTNIATEGKSCKQKENFGPIDKIVDKAFKPAIDFTKTSGKKLQNVFTSVVDSIKKAAINMSTTVASMTKKIPETVQVAINSINKSSKSAINSIKNTNKKVFNSIKKAGTTIGNSVKKAGQTAYVSTKKGVNSVKLYTKKLVDLILKVLKPIVDFIIKIPNAIQKYLKWIVLIGFIIITCFIFGRIKAFSKLILG